MKKITYKDDQIKKVMSHYESKLSEKNLRIKEMEGLIG